MTDTRHRDGFNKMVQDALDGQMEIQRRKNLGRSHNCCSPFSAKLKCGDCVTPYLYEQRIKELFLEAAGILMEKREEIIGGCRLFFSVRGNRMFCVWKFVNN